MRSICSAADRIALLVTAVQAEARPNRRDHLGRSPIQDESSRAKPTLPSLPQPISVASQILQSNAEGKAALMFLPGQEMSIADLPKKKVLENSWFVHLLETGLEPAKTDQREAVRNLDAAKEAPDRISLVTLVYKRKNLPIEV